MKRSKKKQKIAINEVCREDLKFILQVLKNVPTTSTSTPSRTDARHHAYRSDSCPRGFGGFSHQGFAWCFYLEPDLQFRASNNLLEHLAAIITPWIDILAGRLSHGDCALSMNDRTTSKGWLWKTNFIEDREDPLQAPIRIEVGQLHASHYLSLGIREYSQWFPGVKKRSRGRPLPGRRPI